MSSCDKLGDAVGRRKILFYFSKQAINDRPYRVMSFALGGTVLTIRRHKFEGLENYLECLC